MFRAVPPDRPSCVSTMPGKILPPQCSPESFRIHALASGHFHGCHFRSGHRVSAVPGHMEQGNLHRARHSRHPPVVARKRHRLAAIEQVRARRQMQGIEGSHPARAWKGIQRPRQHRRGQLQHRNPSEQRACRLAMGPGEPPGVQRRPHLVFQQSAGNQRPPPQRVRRLPILGQQMSERHGRVEIDQRSRRFSSSSVRTSCSRATGAGFGGRPEPPSAGGVSTPDLTASASSASARIGLRVALTGQSSATTRSRSVTRTVSPDAASRTYSLNRLFSTLIPTDLMHRKVATDRYLVNPSLDATQAPGIQGSRRAPDPGQLLSSSAAASATRAKTLYCDTGLPVEPARLAGTFHRTGLHARLKPTLTNPSPSPNSASPAPCPACPGGDSPTAPACAEPTGKSPRARHRQIHRFAALHKGAHLLQRPHPRGL